MAVTHKGYVDAKIFPDLDRITKFHHSGYIGNINGTFSASHTEISSQTVTKYITTVGDYCLVNAHIKVNDVPPWGLIIIQNPVSGEMIHVFHNDDVGTVTPDEFYFTFFVPAGWHLYVGFGQFNDWVSSAPNPITMNYRFMLNYLTFYKT